MKSENHIGWRNLRQWNKDKTISDDISYTDYEITYLTWDLRTRILKLMVDYYNDKKLLYSKEFEFQSEREEVDVWDLIEEINILHGRGSIKSDSVNI